MSAVDGALAYARAQAPRQAEFLIDTAFEVLRQTELRGIQRHEEAERAQGREIDEYVGERLKPADVVLKIDQAMVERYGVEWYRGWLKGLPAREPGKPERMYLISALMYACVWDASRQLVAWRQINLRRPRRFDRYRMDAARRACILKWSVGPMLVAFCDRQFPDRKWARGLVKSGVWVAELLWKDVALAQSICAVFDERGIGARHSAMIPILDQLWYRWMEKRRNPAFRLGKGAAGPRALGKKHMAICGVLARITGQSEFLHLTPGCRSMKQWREDVARLAGAEALRVADAAYGIMRDPVLMAELALSHAISGGYGNRHDSVDVMAASVRLEKKKRD